MKKIRYMRDIGDGLFAVMEANPGNMGDFVIGLVKKSPSGAFEYDEKLTYMSADAVLASPLWPM